MPSISEMLDSFSGYNWNSAKQRIKAEFRLDPEVDTCEDFMMCDYSSTSFMGRTIVNSRVCVLAFFDTKCLVICPPDNNIMSIVGISYKKIKVINAEKKFLKGTLTFQTDEVNHIFTVSKKELSEIERMVSKHKAR